MFQKPTEENKKTLKKKGNLERLWAEVQKSSWTKQKQKNAKINIKGFYKEVQNDKEKVPITLCNF